MCMVNSIKFSIYLKEHWIWCNVICRICCLNLSRNFYKCIWRFYTCYELQLKSKKIIKVTILAFKKSTQKFREFPSSC